MDNNVQETAESHDRLNPEGSWQYFLIYVSVDRFFDLRILSAWSMAAVSVVGLTNKKWYYAMCTNMCGSAWIFTAFVGWSIEMIPSKFVYFLTKRKIDIVKIKNKFWT